MKKLSRAIKLFFLLPGVFMSISCSADEYTFKSGKKLCVSSEVVEAKKSSSPDRYRRILVRLENMPVDVAISHVDDPSISRSLLLAVEDVDSAEFGEDYYSKVFDQALKSGGLLRDKKLGVYKLHRDTESALKSYDVLKVDPSLEGLTMRPKKLQDWYVGICVEGIGRPDSCEVTYPLDGFILKFSIIYDGLSEWDAVLQKVNASVDSWRCQ